MRRKRAKVPEHQDELDKFYKILTNAQSKRRGNELVVIIPKAFGKIVERATKLCHYDNRRGNYLRGYAASTYLSDIYREGKHFNELHIFEFIPRPQLPSKKNSKPLEIPPPPPSASQFLIFQFRRAMVELRMRSVVNKKITLRTIRTSGRLLRIARNCGLDLVYECERYGVEVIR